MWRKKVDASLFKDAATPIPKWLWKVWDIQNLFERNTSKNSNNLVKVIFGKKEYKGNVYRMLNREFYKLRFDKTLSDVLKDVFLMSYMRSIERDLRKGKSKYANLEIENEIPFWEFLDIEFDSKSKTFYLKDYYIQKPVYIELFKELVGSHTLKIIDDIINNNKDKFRFVKQDWKPRLNLSNQIDAKNVIYNLIDTTNKKIYIGEAESLNQRLKQNRNVILDWDYFRFDCLPAGLTRSQRTAIERLLIRTFASFFKNKKGVKT